jgi:hypothetical protein
MFLHLLSDFLPEPLGRHGFIVSSAGYRFFVTDAAIWAEGTGIVTGTSGVGICCNLSGGDFFN